MVQGLLQCESLAGHVAAVHCAHHCARYVEVEDRSGQFGYTISDSAGRSVGQQSAGSCVALHHGSWHAVRLQYGHIECAQLATPLLYSFTLLHMVNRKTRHQDNTKICMHTLQ